MSQQAEFVGGPFDGKIVSFDKDGPPPCVRLQQVQIGLDLRDLLGAPEPAPVVAHYHREPSPKNEGPVWRLVHVPERGDRRP